MARHALSISLVFCICLWLSASAAIAAVSSDQLLPNTTKGFLLIPDATALQKSFDETQLGQLVHDPLMKPFIDDLKDQLKTKMSKAGVRIGLTFEDVKEVRTGELCLATLQPGGKKDQHAMALIVDVTGKTEAAKALLEKTIANQLQAGGTRNENVVAGVSLTVLTLPVKNSPTETRTVVYFLHQEQLVAIDHLAAAQDIVTRFAGAPKDSLNSLEAYVETMKHARDAAGETAPHIKWFVEPFGYSEINKAAIPVSKRKRGRDLLKVLTKQGFDAVKGMGGFVTFKVNQHELEHHSFVYAPAVKGAPANEKYKLAARMLNFPNKDNLTPLDWVPRDLSVHLSFNMKIQDAFEHVGSLVDELADAPGVWKDILQGLIDDPLGPQIDLKKELVNFAGERVTLISDYRLPITPKSERLALAIEVNNPAAVAKAIAKIMKADPNARSREIDGHIIWEIINEEAAGEAEIDIQIEGAGFTSTNVVQEKKDGPAEDKKAAIPNSAITVLHGHLLVATHLDFIKELLKKPAPEDTLAAAADFKLVDHELVKMGAAQDSFRFFTRTDESYRPTYELLKQGKMPQAETLFGKLLNKIFDDGQGQPRDQQIDGTKMPEYQAVRRYLGPAGFFVRSETDGWRITGCVLSKDEPK